jgi:hypothetical protein
VSGGIVSSFLTSTLDGGEWSASRPYRFTSEERSRGTRWIGCWIDPRAGQDDMEKTQISSLCRETNPDNGVHTLVAIPTELFRLIRFDILLKNDLDKL